jgi:hypothetical protein
MGRWLLRAAACAGALFLLATLATATFSSSADSYDLLGFPHRFYQHTAGKCSPCQNWFRPEPALLNLAYCVPAALLIDFVIRGAFRRKSRRA